MKIIFQIIALILSFFAAVLNFLFPPTAVSDIRQNLDMKIRPSAVVYFEDTHGGFHGDGEEIIIFTPNPEQRKKIKSEWSKTPVEPEIASLIFPENEYNGLELTKYIPNTRGYWFYKNRGDFTYSYNFSFALFDGEKVYYYELDT